MMPFEKLPTWLVLAVLVAAGVALAVAALEAPVWVAMLAHVSGLFVGWTLAKMDAYLDSRRGPRA